MIEDLNRLIELVGLKSKDWISENYFKSGKTKKIIKLMYSNFLIALLILMLIHLHRCQVFQ